MATQKCIRMNISQALLQHFQRNMLDLLRRFIIFVETLVYYDTPQMREQSKLFIKTVYLDEGNNNGAVLHIVIGSVKCRNCHDPIYLERKKILHHDNASAHTSAVAMIKIHELQFEFDLKDRDVHRTRRSTAIWIS